MQEDSYSSAPCPHCGTPVLVGATTCDACHMGIAWLTEAPSLEGTRLGNLELAEQIGSGGMGAVYKAQHSILGTPYAVKILRPDNSADRVSFERFRREAITCSQLRHPNIVFVTDFGYHKQVGLYIVMEHLRGNTLDDALLRKRRLTVWESVHLVGQICEALDHAHTRGVVHRDLKPENVFLVPQTGGRVLVKVLDFGIVRLLEDDTPELSSVGYALGTPSYMSPEQVLGKNNNLDARSDLYSLGVVLFEMLTGHPPFQGSNEYEIFTKHVHGRAPRIGLTRPELEGTQLEALILQLMAKKRSDRPASAREVNERLYEALAECQDRNVVDAFETNHQQSAIANLSGTIAARRASAPRHSKLVKLLSGSVDEDSPLGTFLNWLPDTSSLPSHVLFTAVWGFLFTELRNAGVDSKAFQNAVDQLAQTVDYAMRNAEPDQHQEVTEALSTALSDLMRSVNKARQRPIAAVLATAMSHHLFPVDAMPRWARPRGDAGRTSFTSMLGMEIAMPALEGGLAMSAEPLSNPMTPSFDDEFPEIDIYMEDVHSWDEPLVKDHDLDLVRLPQRQKTHEVKAIEPSLGEKLRRDVNLENIKSVLSHELFARSGSSA